MTISQPGFDSAGFLILNRIEPMAPKDKLLVSFSGGETSGYMTWWIWNNWRDRFDIEIVFANTGDENEETLEFVQKCSDNFLFPVTWVEALVFQNERKSSGHEIVKYSAASRNGEPFEAVIQKYGMPNQNSPHCTRELKERPIKAYAKSIGWDSYYLSIGIRVDEIDRMNAYRSEKKILYPLVTDRPMTKPKINFWWSQQAFRLNLKGYQGNCKACWKKSMPKLYQIARETPEAFATFERLEMSYQNYTPLKRIELMAGRGEVPATPWRFYRGNRTVADIKAEASKWNGSVIDDAIASNFQFDLFDYESDSCEVFSQCGVDN